MIFLDLHLIGALMRKSSFSYIFVTQGKEKTITEKILAPISIIFPEFTRLDCETKKYDEMRTFFIFLTIVPLYKRRSSIREFFDIKD